MEAKLAAPPAMDTFEDLVKTNAALFSTTMATMMKTMFGADFSSANPELSKSGLSTEKNFHVTILFTGMVYGEYIFSCDEELAAQILGQTFQGKSEDEKRLLRRDLADAFCDLLNMTVGDCVVGLNRVYQKLTVTPPRVYFGHATYPQVMMGRSVLASSKGNVECHLFVDRMKLDIASSYKDALTSVLRAHKELQGAMSKLQAQQSFLVHSEKMSALGTMAAGIAHEINTPLAAVSLVGDQMKDMVESDADIDRVTFSSLLNTIDKTVNRISEITHGMRVFSQGTRQKDLSATPIVQVLDNVSLVYEQRLQDEGIHFLFDASKAEGIMVNCRAPEIAQALLSLVGNAADAVYGRVEKWIRIDVSDSADFVEVRIADSGPGIPESIREKIFDPFFTTKDVGKGTGLGLSIARGIIQNHGGDIKLDLKSSNTCFVVTLCKPQVKQRAS